MAKFICNFAEKALSMLGKLC
ncbi:rCG64233 [Rattus norvegicus]|uniref:RCG64233 n=1 Tax=Rattus norvegicus TaxID=10116 RepID=A6K966_RAT|nr:rCG64233 [Rattus norvegicus]